MRFRLKYTVLHTVLKLIPGCENSVTASTNQHEGETTSTAFLTGLPREISGGYGYRVGGKQRNVAQKQLEKCMRIMKDQGLVSALRRMRMQQVRHQKPCSILANKMVDSFADDSLLFVVLIP